VASFFQGTIIWAMMLDPRGLNPKCRPGIVLNSGHQSGEHIVVAALTTTFDEPLKSHVVEIPCNSSTLLKKRCVAVCNWLVVLRESDVVSIGGSVDASMMKEIIERLPKKESPR
jgi:mRNA-degrading endonuclease toxin of MazEF toxin-antitoxin module